MSSLYDAFQRRLQVTGTLVTETGLHIGGASDSIDPTAVDNAVVRLPDGRPYIPGSSLKGVLRCFMERLQNSPGTWLASPGAPPAECLHNKEKEEKRKLLDGLSKACKTEREFAEAVWERLCPVCRLFGCQEFAGRVLVADLMPMEDRVLLERRHSVAIDRETRTAASSALFDMEVVAPGSRFALSILVENPSDAQIRDLMVLLLALSNGEIALGAKTGSGLGRIRLVDARVADYGARDVLAAAWGRERHAYPLAEYIRLLGLEAEEPRVSREALQAALAGIGPQVTWQQAQAVLRELFGGERGAQQGG